MRAFSITKLTSEGKKMEYVEVDCNVAGQVITVALVLPDFDRGTLAAICPSAPEAMMKTIAARLTDPEVVS